MRFLIYCVLVACLSSHASADETAFKEQLTTYVQRNSWAFPPELTGRSLELTINFSIDRDGKLLDAEVAKGEIPATEANGALVALRRMQPFPRVPDDLQAPFKFAAILVFMQPSELGRVRFSWSPGKSTDSLDDAYRRKLQSIIDGSAISLSPEMKSRSNQVHLEVALTIERDGQFSRIDIAEGSGAPSIDRALIRWLKPREPFPPLPESIPAPAHVKARLKIVSPSDPGYQTAREADEARMKARVNGVCRGC